MTISRRGTLAAVVLGFLVILVGGCNDPAPPTPVSNNGKDGGTPRPRPGDKANKGAPNKLDD